MFFHDGKSCSGDLSKTDSCIHAAATASLACGVADGIGALVSFFLLAFFGKLSDLYGRRAILTLFAGFGNLPAFCLWLYLKINIGQFVWGYLVLRALCGVAQNSAVALACLADAVPNIQDRATAFAVLYGLGTSTIALGPVISFFTSAETALTIGLGISLALLLLCVAAFPETCPAARRGRIENAQNLVDPASSHSHQLQQSDTSSNVLADITTSITATCALITEYLKHRGMRNLALTIVFISIPLYGISDTFALYLLIKFGSVLISLIFVILSVTTPQSSSFVLPRSPTSSPFLSSSLVPQTISYNSYELLDYHLITLLLLLW